MGFGLSTVSSLSLDPIPPAKITAFTATLPGTDANDEGLARAELVTMA
jgi:hypothetical protein